MVFPVEILGIYVSSGHDFRGHHGQPRGNHGISEVESVDCVAGQGLAGDRYFGFKEDYRGQITFFDQAIHEKVKKHFGVSPEPQAYRRNVLIAGIELNELIGRRFAIGEIHFAGVEECSPCYWMDQAVAPGTEEFLKGRGGLRARILESGTLRTGPSELMLVEATALT
jgi:hypothetical protein